MMTHAAASSTADIALVSLGASRTRRLRPRRRRRQQQGSARGKTLVIVQLAGGVDGLNTVVPYKDGAYRDERPQHGLPAEQLLPLERARCLPPALGKLKDLSTRARSRSSKASAIPNPNLLSLQSDGHLAGRRPARQARRRLAGTLLRRPNGPPGPSAGRCVRGGRDSPRRSTPTRRPWPRLRTSRRSACSPRPARRTTPTRTATPPEDVRRLPSGEHALRRAARHDAGQRPGGLGAPPKAAGAATSRPCSTRRRRSPPASASSPS